MSSHTSDESRLISGNINLNDRRNRNKKNRNRILQQQPDPEQFEEDPDPEVRIVSDCRGWDRAESTHLQHAGIPAVLLTEEEDEGDLEQGSFMTNDDETVDLRDAQVQASFMTEDNTLYRTANLDSSSDDSFNNNDESSSRSPGTSSFVTAKESVVRFDKTPTQDSRSSLSSSMQRTGMSAQLLFSVGKRKSIFHREMNSRPVLAMDSDEDEDEQHREKIKEKPKNNARKSLVKPRRSILGRNEVILLPSDSDSDFEGEREAAKVRDWIHKSPDQYPDGPRANLSDFRAETYDEGWSSQGFSIQSERTSKMTDQIRTLTLIESGDDDESDDAYLESERTSQDVIRNFDHDSSECTSRKSVGVGHDLSQEEASDDDLDAYSSQGTSKRLGQFGMSIINSPIIESPTEMDESHKSVQVSLLSSEDSKDASVSELEVGFVSPLRPNRLSYSRNDAPPEDMTKETVLLNDSDRNDSVRESPGRDHRYSNSDGETVNDYSLQIVDEKSNSVDVSIRKSSNKSDHFSDSFHSEIKKKSPQRKLTRRYSSSDDDDIDDYFTKLRQKREEEDAKAQEKLLRSEAPIENFVVNDDSVIEVEDNDSEVEEDDSDGDGDEAFVVHSADEESSETGTEDEEDDSVDQGAEEKKKEVVVISDDESSADEELPDIPSPPKTKPTPKLKKPPPKRTPFTPLNVNRWHPAQTEQTLSFMQSLSLTQVDERYKCTYFFNLNSKYRFKLFLKKSLHENA